MSTETTCGTRCRTVSLVLAGLVGALFGAGLLVSGMTRPEKVIAFLDPTSGWDPSLAFVMGGAATVYAIVFHTIRARRSRPWFDIEFHVPTRRDFDRPLIVGAALFGIGWGLGGLCPGPGIVSAASGSIGGLGFALAMLVGLYVQQRATR